MKLILLLYFSFPFLAISQSVSINTDGSTANASALLDIKSTSKGLLIPRMTKTQRNTIASPAKGLMVFVDDVDSVGFHYYNGSSWLWLEILGTAGWKTAGNAGTDTSVNFIGTTDNMPIRFKQNNNWLGQFNRNNGTYFIGKDAGKKNTVTGNIGIGDSALANAVTANQNLAVGYNALKDNAAGNNNTAVGYNALKVNNNTTAVNTAIGSSAAQKNVNGWGITAVGAGALANDTSTGYSTAVGLSSLLANTSGFANTALGANAMFSNKTGQWNLAVGANAMLSSDKADYNTALGVQALYNDTSGYNTAVGLNTLYNNRKGYAGTAIGYWSLYYNTTGTANTTVGAYSLYNNTTGNYGVAVGDSAGYNNTTASSNIFIGHLTGYSNQIRTNLLFMGDSTGYANTAGSEQVFIGNYAGKNHKTNSRNTFVGVYAGYADSIGYNNTFIGEEAGYNNKGTVINTGIRNTFIGQAAGYTNTSGNENTMLGYNADVLSPGLINATAIGANAAVNQSNSLVLGSINGINGATANTLVGIGTTAPDYSLHVVGSRTNDGGWADGIVVENTGTTGEAAISFRNTVIPATRQWTIGMNQNPQLAFSYGGSFAGSVTRLAIDTLGNVGVGTITPAALIDVDGTYKLGTNGTTNSAMIKDTVNIDVGSIAANGEADVIIALANVTTNGAVSISPSADITSGIIIAWARVSAAGTIKIRFRNLTAGAINPAAINYYISVVQ